LALINEFSSRCSCVVERVGLASTYANRANGRRRPAQGSVRNVDRQREPNGPALRGTAEQLSSPAEEEEGARMGMIEQLRSKLLGNTKGSPDLDALDYERDGVLIGRATIERGRVEKSCTALFDAIKSGEVTRRDRFVFGSLPEPAASIWNHPALVAKACELLQTEDIALYMNRVLLKDAGWSGAVAIHQDMPYFHGDTRKLSVFVPLIPTKAIGGNGGLIFIKGSHKYGNLQRGTVRRDAFPSMDDIAPDLDTGDVVYMDFLTWHFSDEAPIPSERPLMQIVYQPATDGSYGSAAMGVNEPTLVRGSWRTSYFSPFGKSTIPDG
jgi:hypothetical protein